MWKINTTPLGENRSQEVSDHIEDHVIDGQMMEQIDELVLYVDNYEVFIDKPSIGMYDIVKAINEAYNADFPSMKGDRLISPEVVAEAFRNKLLCITQ